jgi:hypothetical protein
MNRDADSMFPERLNRLVVCRRRSQKKRNSCETKKYCDRKTKTEAELRRDCEISFFT